MGFWNEHAWARNGLRQSEDSEFFFLARRFRAETGRDWENNADAMSRQQKKSVEAKRKVWGPDSDV